jgi:hypothetical protein
MAMFETAQTMSWMPIQSSKNRLPGMHATFPDPPRTLCGIAQFHCRDRDSKLVKLRAAMWAGVDGVWGGNFLKINWLE